MTNENQIKKSNNNTEEAASSNGRFHNVNQSPEIISIENKDWTDSLKDVFYTRGGKRITDLLAHLQIMAQRLGVILPTTSRTPRVNTISVDREPKKKLISTK